MSGLYYDPYDVEIDARPLSDVPAAAGRGAAVPQRAPRLLGVEPVRRRRRGAEGLQAAQLGQGRHPRGREGRSRDAAGCVHQRGSAGAHHAPGPRLAGVHPQAHEGARGQVRAFCAACLDPLVGCGRFDFVHDLGAEMPMQRSACWSASPMPTSRPCAPRREQAAQQARQAAPGQERPLLRRQRVRRLRGLAGQEPLRRPGHRAAQRRVRGPRPAVRRLTREELLTFIAVIAGAGVETTGRLFGWMGKVLADHPDQRREIAKTARWSPTPSRSSCATSPRGRTWPATSPRTSSTTARPCPRKRDAADGGRSQPRRAALRRPDRFDIHRDHGHSTFGCGAHYCLGAPLARLEGRVALDEVLNRFPKWEVDIDQARRAPTSTVRGWDSMPAIIG